MISFCSSRIYVSPFDGNCRSMTDMQIFSWMASKRMEHHLTHNNWPPGFLMSVRMVPCGWDSALRVNMTVFCFLSILIWVVFFNTFSWNAFDKFLYFSTTLQPDVLDALLPLLCCFKCLWCPNCKNTALRIKNKLHLYYLSQYHHLGFFFSPRREKLLLSLSCQYILIWCQWLLHLYFPPSLYPASTTHLWLICSASELSNSQ